MEPNNALRRMVDGSGMSLRAVSEMMGKTPNHLSSAMQNQDKKSSLLANVARVCGYDLALVPHRSLPPDAIVIDPPE